MKKIIIYLFFLFVMDGCKNNKQIDSAASDVVKSQKSFLTTIDSSFKESYLTMGCDSATEIYRIWRLAAFRDDTSSMIKIEKRGDEVTLTKKSFIYKHSIPIAADSVFHFTKRYLSTEDWRLFKDKVYSSYFWNLTNTNEDDIITDCNTYIFEGARYRKKYTKSYNVFATECPQGLLAEIYNCLWNFSKIHQCSL